MPSPLIWLHLIYMGWHHWAIQCIHDWVRWQDMDRFTYRGINTSLLDTVGMCANA